MMAVSTVAMMAVYWVPSMVVRRAAWMVERMAGPRDLTLVVLMVASRVAMKAVYWVPSMVGMLVA